MGSSSSLPDGGPLNSSEWSASVSSSRFLPYVRALRAAANVAHGEESRVPGPAVQSELVRCGPPPPPTIVVADDNSDGFGALSHVRYQGGDLWVCCGALVLRETTCICESGSSFYRLANDCQVPGCQIFAPSPATPERVPLVWRKQAGTREGVAAPAGRPPARPPVLCFVCVC